MTRLGHNGGPTFATDGGWVAIARSMRNHPIVGFHLHVNPADPGLGAMQPALAFIDLIMECRYEAGFVMNGGRKMAIQRGQMVGAVSWLAARWNWSPKTVRGFLDRLENDGMIDRVRPGIEQGQQKGKQANIVSVCNYDKYQISDDVEGQAKGQAEGTQRASKGQAEGHIYKDNKGTKEQRNKEEEKGEAALPLAADAASDLVVCDTHNGHASQVASPAIESLKAFEAYNALAQRIGLPLARSLKPQRRKQLAARIREHGGYQAWDIALANVERSAFLRGNNPRGWRCDFDFLLQASRFAKVVDGTYGNGAHASAGQPQETEWERMGRLMGDTPPSVPSRHGDIEILPPVRRS